MDKGGIGLALLARFVLACQSATLKDAAAVLGQTPSAVGTALRGLERQLGLQLFVRHGGGLALHPSAFWLFRGACRLLYLEQHLVTAKRTAGRPLRRLHVELDLSFAIGRFSKGLVRATQQFVASQPQFLVGWHFVGEDDNEIETARVGSGRADGLPDISIHYGAAGDRLSPNALRLYEDPWVVVSAPGTELAPGIDREPLYYLGMRPALVAAVTTHASDAGWADRLLAHDAHPSTLGEVLAQFPHHRFVMPASLLAGRLGLVRYAHAPLSPPLVSPLLGECAEGAPKAARQFLTVLRSAMSEEQQAIFVPRLTARQIHYFNLAARSGGISAAARIANVSQSSMSANLAGMETALARPLLERRGDGVRLSAGGADALPLTLSLERQQQWIGRQSHDIAAHAEARVAIGMLPSSGHDSALTAKVAQTVARVHARHPAWRLEVIESTNTVLHERVRSGELNLAIVGMVGPQVTRVPLGPSEQLCVVCNPSLPLGGRDGIGLEEACGLPLVLGPRHLSIHQSFAEAARKRHLRLRLDVEVGSLPLAIAMVKRAPLCTILPASSVRLDAERGALVVIPIRRAELSGSLWVIFSADRELSEAERSITQELVATFRASGSADDADNGAPPNRLPTRAIHVD